MALDNETSHFKQLPPAPEKLVEHYYDEEWPIQRVVRWLDDNGWEAVARPFEDGHVYGHRFLNLSFAEASELLSRSALNDTDKRRLVHSIHALRAMTDSHSHRQIQHPAHDGMERVTNDVAAYPERIQARTPGPHARMPMTGLPAANLSNNTRFAVPSRTAVPPNGMDHDLGVTRPRIPERISSKPEHISKIIKSLNVPQIRTIAAAGRGRSAQTYLNTGSSSAASGRYPSSSNGVNDRMHSPVSPRFHGGDHEEWKIGGRRVPQFHDHSHPASPHPSRGPPSSESREQCIYVTTDGDVLFKLTVTDMHDPVQIKTLILKKMGVDSDCDRYHYYRCHDGVPDQLLTDEELVHICNTSDNTQKNILVKPVEGITPYGFDNGNGNDYGKSLPTYQRSTTAPYPARHPLPYAMHATYPDSSAHPANPVIYTDFHDPSNQPRYPGYFHPDASPRASPVLTNSPVSGWQLSDPSPKYGGEEASHDFEMHRSAGGTPSEEHREDFSYFDRTYKRSSGRSTMTDDSFTSDQSPSRPLPPNAFKALPPQPQPSRSERSVGSQSDPAEVPRPMPAASLWAVAPQKPTTSAAEVTNHEATADVTSPAPAAKQASLWAVPPQPRPSTSERSTTESSQPKRTSATSFWAVPPQPRPSASERTTSEDASDSKSSGTTLTASFWAVPPSTSSSSAATTPRTAPANQSSTNGNPHGALWPTEASASSREQIHLHPSISSEPIAGRRKSGRDDTTEEDKLASSAPPAMIEEAVESLSLQDQPHRERNKRLQIQIPSNHTSDASPSPRTPCDPKTPASATSASPVSASQDNFDIENENWSERPSIERLYRNIDKYLPGHDLDKEIVVEQPATAVPPPVSRRLQGHKKSIRAVANEAHRNWRHAMNVIRAKNILRRKSTKMWGQQVEQVKPGMIAEGQPIVNNPFAFSQTGDKPSPTKLQWMRGELIGKGSFGKVYHALNVAAGEWIAVKQVELPTTKSDLLNDKLRDTVDSLYREISLLEGLDHENIVQYLGYDSDEEEGHINIFLEYVPGGSIASCLSKSGKFDEPLVRFFTRQILLGLEYLHHRNVLHRDIKAGNILLDQNGVCKITDFGLSKLSGQDKAYDPHCNNSVMRGTVFWMAPEVVKGTNYNAKIDIWSLGCTVIEMLTGNHPWLDLNMLAALYSLGKYQAPPIPEDVSDQAKDFLSQCFIINPEDRPTAADLLVHPFVRQDPSFKFKVRYAAIFSSENEEDDPCVFTPIFFIAIHEA
ncbi:uncharacterized protein BYT42DRAFT_584491 [Radiomyces spectabilis]|uniref:uncharacterized protein n=1 Tax=Radiomyces spectabilis TaxID=64574 RepID=UPI00221FC0A9|nr:uncharacterized protein BYT42DRAFT_584491 [Radiomyces spectabilis]KAI8369442.1 hypothetical protein BYT42DRAFT_584491 [Radiomyces spectabilis]